MRQLAVPLTLLGLIAASCRDFGDHSTNESSTGVGGAGGTTGGSGKTSSGGKAGEAESGEAGAIVGGRPGISGSAGVPSDGGVAGALTAGEGGAAGSGANESGSGGEGGKHDPSEGGQSGAGGGDITLVPTCLSTTQNPNYPFDEAADVAASDLQYSRPAAVFTTQPRLNSALITWPAEISASTWVPWQCFDPLLNPRRIAATNLSNNSIEVYAIADGQLQARRLHPDIGWSPWASVSMPRSSGARDIAMLGSPQVYQTEIYLAGTSRLYRRRRVSSEPYANWGSWKAFSEVELRAVAAGRTSSGVRWIVGVGANGQILATNTPSNEDAYLGGFGTIVGGAVDVAAGYESSLALFFVAVDTEGGVWRRTISGGLGEWSLLKAPSQAPMARAISVGSTPGYVPFLFVLDKDGRVHRSRNGVDWTRMD